MQVDAVSPSLSLSLWWTCVALLFALLWRNVSGFELSRSLLSNGGRCPPVARFRALQTPKYIYDTKGRARSIMLGINVLTHMTFDDEQIT